MLKQRLFVGNYAGTEKALRSAGLQKFEQILKQCLERSKIFRTVAFGRDRHRKGNQCFSHGKRRALSAGRISCSGGARRPGREARSPNRRAFQCCVIVKIDLTAYAAVQFVIV